MKLTVLGFYGGYPYKDVGTTSFLLESDHFHLLMDCGSGALMSLEHHLDPFLLDGVILSHYHYDHIADLGVLQYYRQLHPHENKKELPIYGHLLDEPHFKELTLENVSYGVGYEEGKTLEVGPFSIEFLKTKHPVVCYAFKITEKKTGKILTFTGDTGYFPQLETFIAGSHVLLADTYLFQGHENHKAHLTSFEAGKIAKNTGVEKLILTHLPQLGDLSQLQEEAQKVAGEKCLVVLAQKDLVINI